jgi:hypothetical protein
MQAMVTTFDGGALKMKKWTALPARRSSARQETWMRLGLITTKRDGELLRLL